MTLLFRSRRRRRGSASLTGRFLQPRLSTGRPVLLALGVLLTGAVLAGCGRPCLVGCGSEVDLVLEGGADANGGNAVSVGVYQLSSDSRFRQTPVEVFWRDARSALEDDLVGRALTVVLYPDERRILEIDLADDVRFVGVAANLRDPASDGWRRVYPVDDARDGLHLRVEARLLATAPSDP